MRTWEEVQGSPDYQQARNDRDRETIRENYFWNEVAPNINYDDLSWAKEEFDTQTRPRGNVDRGLLGNTGRAIAHGGLRATADMTRLLGKNNPVSGYFDEWAEEQLDDMSPSAIEALNTPLFDKGEEGGYKIHDDADIHSFYLQVMSGLGSTAPMIGGGGLAGKGLSVGARYATGANRLKRAAEASGAASGAINLTAKASARTTMANNIGSRAGYGVVGGQMIGGGAAENARQTVQEMDVEELANAPGFRQKLQEEYAKDGNAEAAFERARDALSEQVADHAFKIAGAGGATSMAVIGPTLGRVATGRSAGSRLGNMGRGYVAESGQEAWESGTEQYATDHALMTHVDDSINPTENVGLASLTGAAIGGPSGGLMGVAAPRMRSVQDAQLSLTELRENNKLIESQLGEPDANVQELQQELFKGYQQEAALEQEIKDRSGMLSRMGDIKLPEIRNPFSTLR